LSRFEKGTMKKRISIEDLSVGMFVDADVQSMSIEGEMRHFLVARDAVYSTPGRKKARLIRSKHKQVAHAGGILLSSVHHIAALQATGLSVVTIDTDKGADAPDGVQVEPPTAPPAPPLTESPAPPPPAPEPQRTSFRRRVPVRLPVIETSEDDMEAAEYEALILGTAETETKGETEQPDDFYLDILEQETGPQGAGSEDLPGRLPPASASGKRRNFGAAQNGWMKVDIVGEGQQADLQVLSFGGDVTLGVEDVVQALKEIYGICSGLDRKMISQLANQAAASPSRVIRGHFPIAQAAHPQDIPPARIHYAFLDEVDREAQLPYDRLRTAFALEKVEEALAQKPLTRVVIPGEKLAIVEPAEDGEEIEDIFGNQRMLHGPEGLLRAGPHVQIVGNSFLSEIYGYVCLLDGEISVISPVWISADEVEAHFVHFPQAGSRSELVRPWLDQLLELERVTHGIKEDEIARLLDDPPDRGTSASFLVACGKPAVPGRDARIEFTFDLEKWSGEQLMDDSFDFRERNTFVAVEKGQLLAEAFPASKGKSGQNLRGEEISVEVGQKKIFKGGENVRVEREKNWPKFFYADIDGNVRVKNDTVYVREMIHIEGDVDYDLGNIKAGKDIFITGSVRSGFTVSAGGSIAIGGTVEPGAAVNAQEDIVVAQGIVGAHTRVVALGDVRAKFVQNSAVMARGDIVVESYLLNAQVQAGGRLAVRSGEDVHGGSIVGGQAFAAAGIWSRRIGSSSTDRTVIGIKPPPDTVARLRKLDKGIEFCQTNILRAFRTLGLRDLDVADFKAFIEKTPREKREPIIRVLKQLKALARTREKSLDRRRKLKRENEKVAEKAEIKVFGATFADVEVHIGSEKLILDEELKAPIFFLADSGIEWRTR
jgi:uncharacterized protein